MIRTSSSQKQKGQQHREVCPTSSTILKTQIRTKHAILLIKSMKIKILVQVWETFAHCQKEGELLRHFKNSLAKFFKPTKSTFIQVLNTYPLTLGIFPAVVLKQVRKIFVDGHLLKQHFSNFLFIKNSNNLNIHQ